MYNTQKVCPRCGWHQGYDKNHDWRKVALLEKCPECQAQLETQPFSPDY